MRSSILKNPNPLTFNITLPAKEPPKVPPGIRNPKTFLEVGQYLHTLLVAEMSHRCDPFEIADVMGSLTYWLKLLETWKIHNVFHASLFRQYRENKVFGANYDRPPAELNNVGQEVYNIETILKHRKQGWGYQYYVKWDGYPITKASWEPEGSFSDDGDLLDQYKRRHQLWTCQPQKLLCWYH